MNIDFECWLADEDGNCGDLDDLVDGPTIHDPDQCKLQSECPHCDDFFSHSQVHSAERRVLEMSCVSPGNAVAIWKDQACAQLGYGQVTIGYGKLTTTGWREVVIYSDGQRREPGTIITPTEAEDMKGQVPPPMIRIAFGGPEPHKAGMALIKAITKCVMPDDQDPGPKPEYSTKRLQVDWEDPENITIKSVVVEE